MGLDDFIENITALIKAHSAERSERKSKKMGQRKSRPIKCEGNLYLQREQLVRRHWEENRHVHQLWALCRNFDQLENIYCAMQLCESCAAIVQTRDIRRT
ncbi:hypothetical protein [Mycoplana sp. BE70]|uniref:hypothetical protein n=1 Tax=Mycoplana sp. BE70 TaxID=2817775 RepID=UPI00286B044C|nr:hypothetical protein [Mycoplana sp. BE70]